MTPILHRFGSKVKELGIWAYSGQVDLNLNLKSLNYGTKLRGNHPKPEGYAY